MTQSYPKGPPPNTITLRVRISRHEFGEGDTNIQIIAVTHVSDSILSTRLSSMSLYIHLIYGSQNIGYKQN